MPAPARSAPPPALASAPRAKALHRAWLTPLPSMRVRTPRRERGRRSTAEHVDATLRRLGVSDVELSEALECPAKLFEHWRDGLEGVQLGDLVALAEHGGERVALAILDSITARIRSRHHGG